VLQVELGASAAGGGQRLVLFPDGRALVFGTRDTALARTLVAKLLGL